jgi:hypothetical protein
MNRRGLLASILPSTIVLGANAAVASKPTLADARTRLIKPKMGPVLEAWVAAGTPDLARTVLVDIIWARGELAVYARENVAVDEYGALTAKTTRFCDESPPGSFMVGDDDARAVVSAVEADREDKVAQLRAVEPLLSIEQWASRRGPHNLFSLPGRKCYWSATKTDDTIHSVALWAPCAMSQRWDAWAVDLGTDAFARTVPSESQVHPLYLDQWACFQLMERTKRAGGNVIGLPQTRSNREAGVKFIRKLVASDKFYNTGPQAEALGESLAKVTVSQTSPGRMNGQDDLSMAFIMAAALACFDVGEANA